MVADHLSRLEAEKGIKDPKDIDESFSDDQLFGVDAFVPWYADIVNFCACKVLQPDLTSQQRKKFLHDMKCDQWDDSLLFSHCSLSLLIMWRAHGTLENISKGFRFWFLLAEYILRLL